MIRNRILLRSIALFFTLELIAQLVVPNIALALTSGPTAPEATSFEPVDTSDMVNLATGDLVYNIPLLEVPGPSGGYPLSLSYHAGIQPNEEASWVGLGWTLNPGAINRTVSGYPDDHNNVPGVARTYWKGSETHTIEVGGVLGVAGIVGVSAGISVSHDRNLGIGAGGWMGLNAGIGGEDSPFSFGANGRIGIAPYGGLYASAGVGVGIGNSSNEGLQLGANAGISTNFNGKGISKYASGGVSVGNGESTNGRSMGNTSLVGASISSGGNGSKKNYSVGSVSGLHNSKAGNVSSESFNITLPLPFVHLGYNYHRYWVDETEVTSTNGSLYSSTSDEGNYRSVGYDTYSLLDPNAEGGIVDNPEPDKVMGGSFADYDSYSVNAQGLSGSIRPYNYKRYLDQQSKYNEDQDKSYYELRNVNLGYNLNKPYFRFVGDFSNSYEYDENSTDWFNTSATLLSYGFNGTSKAGENGKGFNTSTEELAGSKYIEYYTNEDILSVNKLAQQKGFIENSSDDFTRSNTGYLKDQIGGFRIINESGVNYHYSLPVYSYDEYQKTTNKETGAYNTSSKPAKYAYTWLLTGITGPDYVDRNNNGLLDVGDWGYWVNFEYEQWMDDFQWRNPAEGFHTDVDSKFDTYSRGRKEIYYVKQINTQTHQADFITSERVDGREVGNVNTGGFSKYSTTKFDQECYDNCISHCSGSCETVCQNGCTSPVNGPRALKKLDEIILKQREGIVVRKIKLNHDNSLVPGTPNSFDYSAPEIKFGKLTLKGLEFLGKDESSVIPPLNFGYGENPSYDKDNFDHWGLYKAVDKDLLGTNENLARLVTPPDTFSRAAWSLNKIKSPLGSTINIFYESDSYKVGLATQNILKLYDAFIENGELVVKYLDEGVDVSPFIELNKNYDMTLVGSYYRNTSRVVGSYPSYNVQAVKDNVADHCLMWYHFHPETFNLTDLSLNSIDQQSSTMRFDLNSTMGGINQSTYNSKPNPECTIPYTMSDLEYVIYQSPNNWPDFIVGGTFYLSKNVEKYGGGLRVTGIEVDSYDQSKNTKYTYSGGVTSYEPWNVIMPYLNPAYTSPNPTKSKEMISKSILTAYSDLLGNSRELIAPGVIYGNVRVEEYFNSNKIPGYTEYVFQPFYKDMISIVPEEMGVGNGGVYDGISFVEKRTKKITINDKMSQVGALKSVIFYDEHGDKVSETVNHFLHGSIFEKVLEEGYKNQGMIEETFAEARIVRLKKQDEVDYTTSDAAIYKHYGILSQRRHYPNIQTGQTHINYKTGYSSKSDNLAYDFFSGQLIKTGSTDGYGNYIINEVTPAYRKYDDGMGLAMEGGKNMLTQEAQNLTYQYGGENQIIDQVRIHPPGGVEGPDWHVEQLNPYPAIIEPGMYLKFNHKGKNYFAIIVTLTRTGSDLVGLIDFEGEDPLESIDFDVVAQAFTSKNLLNASVQTWSDQTTVVQTTGETTLQPEVWRKHRSYSHTGNSHITVADQGTPYSDYTAFTSWIPNDPAPSVNWQKTSEITLFDVYSHALEASDLNDQYAATRFDANQEKIMATAVNSKYDEFTNLNMEDGVPSTADVGYILGGEATVTPENFHTGKESIKVDANGNALIYWNYKLDATRNYHINFWSTDTSVNINYYQNADNDLKVLAKKEIRKVSNSPWYQVSGTFPLGISDLYIAVKSAPGSYMDDFRFHPFDAAMTSYVYNGWDELEYILDDQNLYTKFIYDGMGRLTSTHRESFNYGEKLIASTDYHYAREALDGYDQLTASFTDNGPRAINQTVTFTGADMSHVEGSSSYSWAITDGSNTINKTGRVVSHIFSEVGPKEVTLTVNNTIYGSKSFKGAITIYDNADPQVQLCLDGYEEYNTSTFTPSTSGENFLCQPEPTSTTYARGKRVLQLGSPNQCPIESYQWKLSANGGQAYDFGTEQASDEFYYQFQPAGEYQLYVIVTDGCGNQTSTVNAPLTITITTNGGPY